VKAVLRISAALWNICITTHTPEMTTNYNNATTQKAAAAHKLRDKPTSQPQ
jgi:hypothetical protein